MNGTPLDNGYQPDRSGSIPAGTPSYPTDSGPAPVGSDPEPIRPGGVSVKAAAALLGMPVSTMYDWVNRDWVRTMVGLSERGKEQRLVPWDEIDRLKAGGRDQLFQQSGRKLDPTGSNSEPVGPEPEPVVSGSEPAGSEPEPRHSGSEPTGTHLACRLHAHARREVERERERLREENTFLKERVVQMEQAEREMRLLWAQNVQAQQQTAHELSELREERQALMAPKSVKWWQRIWGTTPEQRG